VVKKNYEVHFINFAQETPNGLKTRCGAKVKDGRMFPVSNSSQTIIDCFYNYDQIGIKVLTGQSVQSILRKKMFGK
jgi:predicted flavoprotein YhiN